MNERMELIVNGEKRFCAQGAVLEALLPELGLDAKLVVVEVNGEIAPPDSFGAHKLHAGDRLEIIQFVGGG